MDLFTLEAYFSTLLTPKHGCANIESVDVYVGMELSVVPVFQSEIVPTAARGFVVGTYQLSLTVRLD